MRHLVYALSFIILSQTAAFATWSVIALDRATGQVSTATCVAQGRFAGFPAEGLMDIQAVVVPGIGVAACQAGVDSTRNNQRLVFRELQKGTHPEEILRMLKEDPEIERVVSSASSTCRDEVPGSPERATARHRFRSRDVFKEPISISLSRETSSPTTA